MATINSEFGEHLFTYTIQWLWTHRLIIIMLFMNSTDIIIGAISGVVLVLLVVIASIILTSPKLRTKRRTKRKFVTIK